jgi:ribosomal 50S subunit-recycling heat shock protein
MRLDKYLKVSRLIKRRTVANDACDAGRVSVNDKPARASYEVKPGDKLVLSLGAHKLSVEVLEINEHATKDDAMSLYRVIEQS